jgi:hypothetical protein
MIIDGHCHAGRGDAMTAPWDTDAPLRAYLRRARVAGIDRTVVFSAFHGDYRKGNAEVARIVADKPTRLIGFPACTPGGMPGEWTSSSGRR